MKHNKIIMICMAAVVLLIAGCSSETGDSQESGFGGGSSNSNSPSPTKGVVLEFAEENPADEIFKGNSVDFAFVFKNNQEHAIENLELRTSGFDRGFVSGLNEEYSINRIPPATQAAGQGVYPGLVVNGVVVDNFQDKYDFNPKFTYCYEATSIHQESVCVPSSQNQCETEFQASKSANGPLTVSISSINSLENSILIRFNVENKGTGRVVNECFNTQDYATSYDVEARLGTQQGNCDPAGAEEFLLNNGNTGSFQCEFSRTSDESYSSQLVVDLGHLYQQSLRKEISVVDLS